MCFYHYCGEIEFLHKEESLRLDLIAGISISWVEKRNKIGGFNIKFIRT